MEQLKYEKNIVAKTNFKEQQQIAKQEVKIQDIQEDQNYLSRQKENSKISVEFEQPQDFKSTIISQNTDNSVIDLDLTKAENLGSENYQQYMQQKISSQENSLKSCNESQQNLYQVKVETFQQSQNQTIIKDNTYSLINKDQKSQKQLGEQINGCEYKQQWQNIQISNQMKQLDIQAEEKQKNEMLKKKIKEQKKILKKSIHDIKYKQQKQKVAEVKQQNTCKCEKSKCSDGNCFCTKKGGKCNINCSCYKNTGHCFNADEELQQFLRQREIEQKKIQQQNKQIEELENQMKKHKQKMNEKTFILQKISIESNN